MTNRYTNLDGARRISETYDQINIGFDKVQEEMHAKETPEGAQEKIDQAKADAIKEAADTLTAHKQRGADEHPAAAANAAGFMSAADKKKLDASASAATASVLMQRDASGRAQVAAPAADADIARKKEVDDVQSGLNAHKQDTVAHLTQTEHEKLTNIESGAQKNQKAFGSVNGIAAETTTDGLTIEGATGISVTKDRKKIILTATGQSTPGAHAATHLPGGADPIQTATTEQPGLMSAAQATALAAAESKTDAASKLQAAKDYTDASRLYGTTTNTGNAYALTIANGPVLGKFRKITVEINADSTGAATLSYNGGSALPIRKMTGAGAVAVTNLKAGGIYSLAYSGSAFILQGEGGSTEMQARVTCVRGKRSARTVDWLPAPYRSAPRRP
ncbi:hypothetical protein CDO73_03570 [Saccharibacillus sp. O23]|uniref:hypothetical protein n=1 Tax=Saccharibacillus sp. O23 TaxID=2009338 RepID=UPI000B722FF6|nr:hypothetical protein [Saccharibacillus sp. O23]OWR32691.1 hypothetical protein CDO73_03570 [Saccharibacillus sp. O23]